MSRNPSSTTWIVRSVGEAPVGRWFLKHHREQAMYDREKTVLDALREHSGDQERYAVPRIAAWNDDLRVLALEWLEARPVGPVLRSAVARVGGSARSEEVGLRTSREVGCWLRKFEERTRVREPRRFPSDVISSRIWSLQRLIVAANLGGFGSEETKALRAFVEVNLSRMEDQCEFVALHRDFWFGHVWQREAGIVVIDFGRCIPGPSGRDAVQFLLRLAGLGRMNPLVSSGAVRGLQREFLRGYQRMEFDTPITNLYVVLTTLEHLGGEVEKPRRGVVGALKVRALVKAQLRWLASFVAAPREVLEHDRSS